MYMLEQLQQRLAPYAPLFLRLGISIVFFLFAFQKLSNPEQGRAEIQLLLNIGLGGAAALNFYLGLAELIIGVCLLLGAFIKYAGLGAFILIGMFFLGIVTKYGITQDPTLNRDLGLIGASFTLWLLGAGPFSIDRWREKRKSPATQQ